MGGQKFVLLLCADDSDYVKKMYGGYYGVFVRMLKEDGESWDVFRVAKGEFPAEDQIADYDGFVITDSCNDAHGSDLWICKLLHGGRQRRRWTAAAEQRRMATALDGGS